LVDDPTLRSTLFGGLIASVGAAVAFYFSSKTTDQAVNAAVAMSQGGTQPTTFSQATPPSGNLGKTYNYRFNANGLPPPTFQVVTGMVNQQLPPGLTLDTDGTLRGTPQSLGNFTFLIAASNAAGTLVSQPMTVLIEA